MIETASLRSNIAAGDRICILTPGSIGSNPRVVKEADALHEAGFLVTVISTRTLERVEPRDQALMQRIKWRLKRIDLRSRLNWRLLRVPQLAARQLYGLTSLHGLASMGFSPFTAALRREAEMTLADLYIAHYPAALPVAAAAAKRNGACYAYDAEDYHLGDWPDDVAFDLDRRLVRGIEGRYLPGCAYVTAASPGIADALVSAYGIPRPRVVLNVFPLDQAPPGPTPRGVTEPGPSLYWFSQTIGPDRGLECAVRAIAAATTRPHLYLRGSLAAGYGEQSRELAAGVGAPDRLHFLEPAAPDDMEKLAAAYDLGFCGEPGYTANNLMALSNKLFSYLLAGVPPLMSDTPAHRAFAAEAGLQHLVYTADDPVALAVLLDRLLGDPTQLAAIRADVWRMGRERYNWRIEGGSLVETVGRATRSETPPSVVADAQTV